MWFIILCYFYFFYNRVIYTTYAYDIYIYITYMCCITTSYSKKCKGYKFLVIAVDSCYDATNKGFFYRGEISVTERGECSHWNDMHQIDYNMFYDHVGLDSNNFCRNTVVFQTESRPWCYSKGVKTLCGIPECQGKQTIVSNRKVGIRMISLQIS